MIYKGWNTGELSYSIDVPCIYHYMMSDTSIPLYSFSLDPVSGDEIVKLAALAPPAELLEGEASPSPKK